jgi:hypothetical protein
VGEQECNGGRQELELGDLQLEVVGLVAANLDQLWWKLAGVKEGGLNWWEESGEPYGVFLGVMQERDLKVLNWSWSEGQQLQLVLL